MSKLSQPIFGMSGLPRPMSRILRPVFVSQTPTNSCPINSCPDFVVRAASKFSPNLHSRTGSLSLVSLDMSRAVSRHSLDMPKTCRGSLMGHGSLDIPKTGRKNLVIKSRKSQHTKILSRKLQKLAKTLTHIFQNFATLCPDFRDQFSQSLFNMCRLWRPTARLMSRLTRLKF